MRRRQVSKNMSNHKLFKKNEKWQNQKLKHKKNQTKKLKFTKPYLISN